MRAPPPEWGQQRGHRRRFAPRVHRSSARPSFALSHPHKLPEVCSALVTGEVSAEGRKRKSGNNSENRKG